MAMYYVLIQSLGSFSQDIVLGIVVHEIIHALGFSSSLYHRLVESFKVMWLMLSI